MLELEQETWCCWGSIMNGPDACTCWTVELDLEQAPIQEGPLELRAKCCHDCAYRNGSPERADERQADELERAAAHGVFLCHQGVPRAVEHSHPDGRTRAGDPADYRPIKAADRIWRADGRPGQLCAGWATHAAAIDRARARFDR